MADEALEDWRELLRLGLSPLTVLMLYAGGSDAPPRGLLQALRADYDRYFDAAGRLSLEEALLHKKPRKGEGNAAQRAFKKDPRLQAIVVYADLRRRGVSGLEAAAIVTRKYHPVDPSSFEREMRLIRRRLQAAGHEEQTEKPARPDSQRRWKSSRRR